MQHEHAAPVLPGRPADEQPQRLAAYVPNELGRGVLLVLKVFEELVQLVNIDDLHEPAPRHRLGQAEQLAGRRVEQQGPSPAIQGHHPFAHGDQHGLEPIALGGELPHGALQLAGELLDGPRDAFELRGLGEVQRRAIFTAGEGLGVREQQRQVPVGQPRGEAGHEQARADAAQGEQGEEREQRVIVGLGSGLGGEEDRAAGERAPDRPAVGAELYDAVVLGGWVIENGAQIVAVGCVPRGASDADANAALVGERAQRGPLEARGRRDQQLDAVGHGGLVARDEVGRQDDPVPEHGGPEQGDQQPTGQGEQHAPKAGVQMGSASSSGLPAKR